MRNLRDWWPRTPWWWLVMLLPGLALLIMVPLVVEDGSTTARLLGTLPGVVSFVLPLWFTVDVARRDRRQQALQDRGGVLDPIRPAPLEWGQSPLTQLDARRCRSGFYARGRALDQLTGWLDRSPSPVVIVEGPALSGKTRLALEWADGLSPAWVAGWLRRDRGDDLVERAGRRGENVVVMTEGFSADLSRLLERLAVHSSKPAVRVLVTARDARGLVERLRRVSPDAAALADGATVVRLDALGEPSDHERWFDQLCRYYAGLQKPPVPSVSLGRPPEWEAPPIGLLHVAALAAVRRGSRPSHRLDLSAELGDLWYAEVQAWERPRDDPTWALGSFADAELERAVLALSLLAPSDPDAAESILRRIPELTDVESGSLRRLARWASQTYPPAEGSAPAVDVEPHLLADVVFLRLAAADRGFAEAVLGEPGEDRALALTTRLIRAVPLVHSASTWIPMLIDGRPSRLRHAVEEALLTAPAYHRLDAQLANSVLGCELEEESTSELLRLIPRQSLVRTRTALATKIVSITRVRAAEDPDRYLPELARSLHNQSNELTTECGRSAEALAAIDQAVAIRRQLAAADPARYLPDLASSLNNQAIRFSEVGRCSANALNAVEEAVAIRRPLADGDPARYLPDLASSLNNLSNRLSEVGWRGADALRTIDEAVAIYRPLAARDPGRHLPDLARSLTNQATSLKEVGGRTAYALTAIDEAVAIYRLLAAGDPGRHLPDLARSLHIQASCLSEVAGRSADALSAVTEAVAIYRPLATDDPARHRPGLALSLHIQANCLSEVAGRGADALKAADEAVATYRRLAADDPARHRPGLAGALTNQATRLRAVGGRSADALKAINEAVTIRRALATDEPARYLPALALSVHNQANQLGETRGRSADALVAIAEAVAGYRWLVARKGARHEADLAMALHSQSILLKEAADVVESTRRAREALDIFTSLTQREPRRWQSRREQEVQWLRRLLEQQGMRAESLTEGVTGE